MEIEISLFSNSWLLFLILVVALLLASFVTFFIAQRVGKSISEKYKRWIYLFVSLLPLMELIKIINSNESVLKSLFFWFWFLFWSYCLFMFWRLRNQKKENFKEAR